MPAIAVLLKIDGEAVADALHAVLAKLENAGGEVVLDFSNVSRIDPNGLAALEKLAEAAEAKAVSIALRSVAVDVYKVLKLVKLAPRFDFLN